MTTKEDYMTAVLKKRAELKHYVYDASEEDDGEAETTWYVPYTHGDQTFELEVRECNGKFGLHWCETNEIIQKILGIRTSDAAGRYKWDYERSLALFAQYPTIPRDEWRKTKPSDMSPEWRDFWIVHEDHMNSGADFKKNQPPYRNFWHKVLQHSFKHFKRDDFNAFPIEYYRPEHMVWERNKCFHPILNLHKDIAYEVAHLFPEIQLAGPYVKTSINYWVYW